MRAVRTWLCALLIVGCGGGPPVRGPSPSVRTYAGALQRALDRGRAQLMGGDVREGAVERSDGRARSTGDYN